MIQTVLISAMNHMRIFMKDKEYSPEDEYRAVLIVPEEMIRNSQLPERFDNGISDEGKPFVDVPFAPKSINRVLVGSGVKEEFSLVKKGLEDWFLQQNLNNINIYESNIL